MPAYTLDPYIWPGLVVVVVENHPAYLAENFHQAERFVEQMLSDQPILLAAPVQAHPLVTFLLEQFADLL